MYFCNKILRRSHRFGSRTREPNGDGTSIGRRAVSRHLPRAARTASPAGDPHRWAQPPSSWGTVTACLPPTRFTITTTTPKPRRPSASETCTSHPVHRAEHDKVPTNEPSPLERGGNLQCTYEILSHFVTVAAWYARHSYDRRHVSAVCSVCCHYHDSF